MTAGAPDGATEYVMVHLSCRVSPGNAPETIKPSPSSRTWYDSDMSAPAPRLATYEDLLQLPDNMVGELVNGQLIATPRPGPAHAFVATGLTISVGSPFHFGNGGPGGWVILAEPELHLGTDVLVPDLAG